MEHTVTIYLAPFQSITTHTYRKVYAAHFGGVSKYYTPFFSKIDHDTRLSERKLRELQHLDVGLPEVVPQILSKDPGEILRFGRICAGMGFNELNWNLGCPYPQVADKKRGSGLLMYPNIIDEILEKVMSAIPLKFSVKCRLGYEDKEEIEPLIPIFNKYPLHEVTVHGRIGTQLYSGMADHLKVALAAERLKAPFVHNGDLMTVDDYNHLSSFIKPAAWMIGRGILSNPFLPEDISGIVSETDRMKRLRLFLDDLYFNYRKDMNDRLTILNLLKEYWDYLETWFSDPLKIKRLIKKARTFEEYEDAVVKIFQSYHSTPYRTDQER